MRVCLGVLHATMTRTLFFWFWVSTARGGVFGGRVPCICISNNDISSSSQPVVFIVSNTCFRRADNNGLRGKLPAQEIGHLSHLIKLNLGSNSCLTGTFAEELGELGQLEDVLLDFDDISGTIPSQLGKLKNLVTFDVRGNRLSGRLPTSIGFLSNLTFLSVADNSFTGTVPASFVNLSSLDEFWLYSNDITGDITFLCPTNVTKIAADCENDQVSCTCAKCDCYS